TLIYTNDGAGVFSAMPALPLPAGQQFGNKAADIDGDSDPDIYMSGSSNGGGPDISVLYRNETQISLGVGDNGVFSDLTAFPNPTNNDINLNFGENIETFKVELYSLTGKLIQTKSYRNTNTAVFQINASAGVYPLTVLDENFNQATLKVVKR
ncbi:MAG: T9SS type A sorting domain-containing protein, partial [Cryomorphaceae bacterium]